MVTNDEPYHEQTARSGLRAIYLDSYAAAAPFWHELNRTYKSGELTVDLNAHEIIWNRFYKPRGYALQIVVVLEDTRCVGIFPLLRSNDDPFDAPYWNVNDDFIISREYFCAPHELPAAAALLPPHLADDLSCFYEIGEHPKFGRSAGGVIDIKQSEAAYLDSLPKRHRGGLRRNLKKNLDIRSESDTRIRSDVVEQLLPSYLHGWKMKEGCHDLAYYQYCTDKIACDLALLARAEQMGRLVAVYLFLDDQPLAANFSVRREQDRIDDYLCLRNCDNGHRPRGLGILAILRNMAYCRSLGIVYYDLSACMSHYKTQFLNNTTSFGYLRYDSLPGVVNPLPMTLDRHDPSQQLATGT